jgi:hypothetical protein
MKKKGGRVVLHALPLYKNHKSRVKNALLRPLDRFYEGKVFLYSYRVTTIK